MFETYTYNDSQILPESARNYWKFMETNSASAVMKAVCPHEWQDIVDVLSGYRLRPQHWLRAGGNRGDIAAQIDKEFHDRGWKEARLDLETKGTLYSKKDVLLEELPSVHQEGYLVDNFKNRIVLDVEWNAKDGNLDRDLSAYRSWYEVGVISAGVIITKDRASLRSLAMRIWQTYQQTLPETSRNPDLPIDLDTSTTTTFEKAALRVRRGVMGTCPILIVGADETTWNGEQYLL